MPLLHEIWEYEEDDMTLQCCCYAGSRGNGERSLLPSNAKLLTVFEASSHFEAMTIYYRFLGRGVYTTDQAWDFEPYPESWEREQREGLG